MINVKVRYEYDLENVSTIESLLESPYVNFKHANFELLYNLFIHSFDFRKLYSWDNKVQYYKRNISIIKSSKNLIIDIIIILHCL